MTTVPLSYTCISGRLEMVDVLNRLHYQARLIEMLIHEYELLELDSGLAAAYAPLQHNIVQMERLYDAVYGKLLSEYVQIDCEKIQVDLGLVAYANLILRETFEGLVNTFSELAGFDVRDQLDELPSETIFGVGISRHTN